MGGLMLANSTAVRHIFDRTLGLYDRLMERKVTFEDAVMPHGTCTVVV